jgi:hypothetical protein
MKTFLFKPGSPESLLPVNLPAMQRFHNRIKSIPPAKRSGVSDLELKKRITFVHVYHSNYSK